MRYFVSKRTYLLAGVLSVLTFTVAHAGCICANGVNERAGLFLSGFDPVEFVIVLQGDIPISGGGPGAPPGSSWRNPFPPKDSPMNPPIVSNGANTTLVFESEPFGSGPDTTQGDYPHLGYTQQSTGMVPHGAASLFTLEQYWQDAAGTKVFVASEAISINTTGGDLTTPQYDVLSGNANGTPFWYRFTVPAGSNVTESITNPIPPDNPSPLTLTITDAGFYQFVGDSNFPTLDIMNESSLPVEDAIQVPDLDGPLAPGQSTAVVSLTVPEPTSLAILGTALAGLGFVRRRRPGRIAKLAGVGRTQNLD